MGSLNPTFEEIMRGVEQDSVIVHLYGQIEERANADDDPRPTG